MMIVILGIVLLGFNFLISIINIYRADEQTKGAWLHGMVGWCWALMIWVLFTCGNIFTLIGSWFR